MRAILLAVALLIWAETPAGYAQRNLESDEVSKIVAMEHVWAQAYIGKDARALARILDDNFICVVSNGKMMTKADAMEDVKTSTAQQVLTETMVVHLHGDTAIVTGGFWTKGMERGKPYARRERFMDTWISKNGQWISISSMVTLAGD